MKMAMVNPSGVVNYTKDITAPSSAIPRRRNIQSRSLNNPGHIRATTGMKHGRMSNMLQKTET